MSHPSGAIVHRSQRVAEAGPRKRMVKVYFTCANRGSGEHKGVVYLSHTKTDAWAGLCSDCYRQRPDPKKLTEDQTIEGAQLLFSKEEGGLVPIVYDVCKHVRPAPRHTALAYRHTGRIRGVCLGCRNNPAALAQRLAELATGNGRENGGAQKNPVGRPRADANQTLASIRREVLQMKAQNKPRSYATANRVAALLHIGGVTGGNTMMERIKNGGIQITWPELRDLIWDGGQMPTAPINSGE